jgi:hypothetical protein
LITTNGKLCTHERKKPFFFLTGVLDIRHKPYYFQKKQTKYLNNNKLQFLTYLAPSPYSPSTRLYKHSFCLD